jgi:uncharacterized protein (DUF1684 family)
MSNEQQGNQADELWEQFVTRNYNDGISLVVSATDEEIVKILDDLERSEIEHERERRAARIKRQAINSFVNDKKAHLSKELRKKKDSAFAATLSPTAGLESVTRKAEKIEKPKLSKQERLAALMQEFGADFDEFQKALDAKKTTSQDAE